MVAVVTGLSVHGLFRGVLRDGFGLLGFRFFSLRLSQALVPSFWPKIEDCPIRSVTLLKRKSNQSPCRFWDPGLSFLMRVSRFSAGCLLLRLSLHLMQSVFSVRHAGGG